MLSKGKKGGGRGVKKTGKDRKIKVETVVLLLQY